MKGWLLSLSFLAVLGAAAQTVTGRTTGALPYLAYGLGEDRLGGAKLTYLDTGILVRVVDSVQDNYKVQLSAQHTAYLPKQNFRFDTTVKKGARLTASWRVWGDARYDYVTVSLDEKLPYRSRQDIDPARIVVDIFGVVSNTNWITQLKTVKEVKNVWYEQLEDDVFRVYIELKHKQHWGYSIAYQRNNLVVRVRRQPESLKPRRLLVAIDAGHGGSNTGASGLTSGILEKNYTLLIAKQVESYFRKKHVRVYMTRTGDTDLTMIERTLMLRQQQPDLLISIHLNASSNAQASGVSTYYRYIGFRPLSQAILNRMLGLGLNNFGNVGSFNFALSGPTDYPNCLVETAFLTNADDERKVLDPSFHKKVAKAIYRGMRDWLKKL